MLQQEPDTQNLVTRNLLMSTDKKQTYYPTNEIDFKINSNYQRHAPKSVRVFLVCVHSKKCNSIKPFRKACACIGEAPVGSLKRVSASFGV